MEIMWTQILVEYNGKNYYRWTDYMNSSEPRWAHTDDAFPIGVGDNIKDPELIAELNSNFNAIPVVYRYLGEDK